MEEKALLDMIPNYLTQGDDIIVGPGDDCAVIDLGVEKLYLMAVDQLIANIHYLKDSTTPALIAKKILSRNISDIAAMGGEPAHALLAMTLSKDIDEEWVKEFFTTMGEEAKRWNISLCGGDISSTNSPEESMSLTITGWVNRDKLSLRSTALNGDILYATGRFGNSFPSEHHLHFTPRLREAQFIAGEFTNTIIDVSDGVLMDSARVAEASKLGLRLNCEKILPRDNASITQRLSDGEDYELLFAVSKSKADKLEREWDFKSCELSAIGEFSDQIEAGSVVDSKGKSLYSLSRILDNQGGNSANSAKDKKIGFDHFQK